MKFWLIRTDAPSVRVVAQNLVYIRSKRMPRIKPGDTAVLFDRLHFSRWGLVETFDAAEDEVLALRAPPGFPEVGDSETDLEQPEPRWFLLTVSGWEKIEDANVDDLRFSLTFIKNMQTPRLNLRRSYRSLREHDFKTMVQGDVFLARTAYFELLTALPRETQIEFEISQLMRGGKPIYFGDFEELLRALERFIDQRVLSVGRSLGDLVDRIEAMELGSDLGNKLEHCFSDEASAGESRTARSSAQSRFALNRAERESSGNIRRQAALFAPLLRPTDQSPRGDALFREFSSEIFEAIAEPGQEAIERRLQRAFEANP